VDYSLKKAQEFTEGSKMNTHSSIKELQYIFAGPLNLNRSTKAAGTVMGSDIVLGENDFEALFLLALNEGKHLTFEQLYEAAWGNSEEAANLDLANSALNDLMQLINRIGDGFMWIEHTPELGYIFKTRWGHNWRTQSSDIEPFKQDSTCLCRA